MCLGMPIIRIFSFLLEQAWLHLHSYFATAVQTAVNSAVICIATHLFWLYCYQQPTLKNTSVKPPKTPTRSALPSDVNHEVGATATHLIFSCLIFDHRKSSEEPVFVLLRHLPKSARIPLICFQSATFPTSSPKPSHKATRRLTGDYICMVKLSVSSSDSKSISLPISASLNISCSVLRVEADNNFALCTADATSSR